MKKRMIGAGLMALAIAAFALVGSGLAIHRASAAPAPAGTPKQETADLSEAKGETKDAVETAGQADVQQEGEHTDGPTGN